MKHKHKYCFICDFIYWSCYQAWLATAELTWMTCTSIRITSLCLKKRNEVWTRAHTRFCSNKIRRHLAKVCHKYWSTITTEVQKIFSMCCATCQVGVCNYLDIFLFWVLCCFCQKFWVLTCEGRPTGERHTPDAGHRLLVNRVSLRVLCCWSRSDCNLCHWPTKHMCVAHVPAPTSHL